MIENSYYAPRLKLTLLSPRQWSLQGPLRRDGSRIRQWTVDGDATVMRFEHGVKTVPYDPKSNLPLLTTKPGFHTFEAHLNSLHLTSMEARLRPTALTMDNAILPPGARLPTLRESLPSSYNSTDPFQMKKAGPEPALAQGELLTEDLNFESILNDNEEDSTKNLRNLNETDKRTLLLRWHYRLGHMPFKDLRAMAQAGLLDTRLKTIQEFPFCPGCQFRYVVC